MDPELKRHLDRLLWRAAATLSLVVAALVFLLLTLAFFWAQKAAAFLFFLLFIAAALAFAVLGRLSRREGHRQLPEPVPMPAKHILSFEELDVILRQMTDKQSAESLHHNILLYDLHGDTEARIILYKTPAFDKKEFDNLRVQLEQKAGAAERGAFRLCLVCVSRTDKALLRQVADNALHGLSREGSALYAAVYHDKIELPPLFGSCDVRDVLRYRKLARFVEAKLI